MAKKQTETDDPTAAPAAETAAAAVPLPGAQHLLLPTASLIPHPLNPRVHPLYQLELLAKSLERYGQRRALVVQESTRFIVAGEGVWRAAVRLNLPDLWCDVWDCAEAEALSYMGDDNYLYDFGTVSEDLQDSYWQALHSQSLELVTVNMDEITQRLLAAQKIAPSTPAEAAVKPEEDLAKMTRRSFVISREELAQLNSALAVAEDFLNLDHAKTEKSVRDRQALAHIITTFLTAP